MFKQATLTNKEILVIGWQYNPTFPFRLENHGGMVVRAFRRYLGARETIMEKRK